jgi:alkylation response protein AidB-like acyl-CoA dehydrogenase
MRVGELGALAADGVGDLLERSLGGTPLASYAEERPLRWATLREGGWDELGVPEEAGGAGATLRDLTEVALVWGARCVPSPLIGTILGKRWSAAAREQDGPLTVAVRTSSGVVAPFGAEPGIRVLSGLGAGCDGFLDAQAGPVDPFALTLRTVAAGDEPTAFAPAAARELGVLWAAEGVGAARSRLADAVEYAKERKQFGKPIGSFQAIKHRAAHALELVERAETAALWAASDGFVEGEESISTRRLVLHALATAQEVVESCLQIYGGMGFTWEMGVHVSLRHVIGLRELAEGLPLGPG